jgi:hypothetical protein
MCLLFQVVLEVGDRLDFGFFVFFALVLRRRGLGHASPYRGGADSGHRGGAKNLAAADCFGRLRIYWLFRRRSSLVNLLLFEYTTAIGF